MAVGLYGAVTGCDPLAGVSLSWWERVLGALNGLGPIIDKIPFLRDCPGGCFVAGTPVQMADGTEKPIEQVQPGDRVMSRNPQTGQTEAKQVESVNRHTTNQVLTLSLADADTGKVVQSLTCTPNHPLYAAGQGFVQAGEAGIGTQILTRAGPPLVVQAVEYAPQDREYPVYNFIVRGDHTYFVGDAEGGAWVHNGGPRCSTWVDNFFNTYKKLKRGDYNVHHAIPQKVFRRWPGLFNPAEKDAVDNLRGIPNEINSWFHISAINRRWNQFYRTHLNPTRQEIEDFRDLIDKEYGGNFVPYH